MATLMIVRGFGRPFLYRFIKPLPHPLPNGIEPRSYL